MSTLKMMLKSLTYQSMSKPCRINGRTSFPMAQATIPSRRRQHWAYSPATVGFGFHWGPLDIHLEQAVICEYIYIYVWRFLKSHGGTPIHFVFLDFPWNKASSYWGTSVYPKQKPGETRLTNYLGFVGYRTPSQSWTETRVSGSHLWM